jgi:hypothetical protein
VDHFHTHRHASAEGPHLSPLPPVHHRADWTGAISPTPLLPQAPRFSVHRAGEDLNALGTHYMECAHNRSLSHRLHCTTEAIKTFAAPRTASVAVLVAATVAILIS